MEMWDATRPDAQAPGAAPPSDETDPLRPLLDRLARGDTDALGALFARYQDQLRRMIDLRLDRRLRGRVSTSDVVQETYIDAQKRVRHFLDKPELPFFVWLRLVAGQRLVEVHRQHLGAQMRGAAREVSLDRGGMATASSACLADRLADRASSPSHAARRGERRTLLEQMLDGLDPIDREVLALRHFEELSNREVAAILGLENAAASKRYVRALARLREALSSLPEFSDAD